MSYQASASRYAGMPYRRSGKSGLDLPAISLGLWHNFGGVDTFQNSRDMLLRAFDLGITHFDLANNYGPPPGSAEETLGRVLRTDLASLPRRARDLHQGGLRRCGPVRTATGARASTWSRSLDQSLKRMGLDYVDIFYHHRPDPETPLEETMGALDFIVRQRQGALRRHLQLQAGQDARGRRRCCATSARRA